MAVRFARHGFITEMNYVHNSKSRPIKVYTSVDTRFILEDFFVKLAIFASKQEGRDSNRQRLSLIIKHGG